MSAPTPARGRAAGLAVAVARLVRYPATRARLPQAMWISSRVGGVACVVAVASLPGWGFIGSRDVFYAAILLALASILTSSVCHYLDRRPGPRRWAGVSRLVHGVVAPAGSTAAMSVIVARWARWPESPLVMRFAVAALATLVVVMVVDLWWLWVARRRGRG